MKKAISSILLTVMLAVQLSGCGTDGKDASGAPDRAQGADASEASNTAQGADASGASDAAQDTVLPAGQKISAGSGGVLDPSAVLELSGKDNSLDILAAAARVPLQTENPENAIEGGGKGSFLGASRAYYFKKHLFKTAAECWDELSFVTAEGETGSESFDWENQLWGIGPVVGTDHYVTFGMEVQEGGEECRYYLTERDEKHEKIREFPLDFLSGSIDKVLTSLSDFAVDQSGVAHLVRQMEEGTQYLLVSQKGEILAEYVPQGWDIRGLIPLYDGRIAFWSEAKADDGGKVLQFMDAETDRLVTLAGWENQEKDIYYFTLQDEKTLLYADSEGVYRSGLSGEKPELLYRWINHGIIAHGVSGMQADGEGRIALIYSDSEKDNYLCLEPAAGEAVLCEISLAVPVWGRGAYEWAAAEFNKRYPGCHIELIEYSYKDTALLTQLAAGKGPVLVDTFLVDFAELEELWEPLDAVMEQLGVMEEMLPTVLEIGKINGTLYGMVGQFCLRTVIARDPALKGWDYDAFFQGVQDRTELEAVSDYFDRESGCYYLLDLLNHGLDDNYFLVQDGETGRMHFDSGRFRKFLELADKYYGCEEGVTIGSSLLEGKALCNRVSINRPEDVAAYRVVYGEDACYIGYPTKDGAVHFMELSSMLSIRRSATKEEKEAAAAFIGLCLSYEGQTQAVKDINFDLSVRRDVLEEQIASMKSRTNMAFLGEISLGGKKNIELDRKTLLDMIDEARPRRALPSELMNILSEELDQYFAGDITEDMLIDHLESRVGLYLGERN